MRRSYRCICAACRRLLNSGSPLREISCHNQTEAQRDPHAIHAPRLDIWASQPKYHLSIWRRDGGGSPTAWSATHAASMANRIFRIVR